MFNFVRSCMQKARKWMNKTTQTVRNTIYVERNSSNNIQQFDKALEHYPTQRELAKHNKEQCT